MNWDMDVNLSMLGSGFEATTLAELDESLDSCGWMYGAGFPNQRNLAGVAALSRRGGGVNMARCRILTRKRRRRSLRATVEELRIPTSALPNGYPLHVIEQGLAAARAESLARGQIPGGTDFLDLSRFCSLVADFMIMNGGGGGGGGGSSSEARGGNGNGDEGCASQDGELDGGAEERGRQTAEADRR
jgi:hypothetical protein